MDRARAGWVAERLSLQARIGGRTPRPLLEREVGTELAVELGRHARATAGAALLGEKVCRDLAARARPLGVPLVFLKGVALHLTGVAPPGQRPLGDVDVLAPSGRVGELQAALVASGMAAMDVVPGEHQLQSLLHQTGMTVEVHRCVRGVRLGGSGSATAEELLAAGLCAPAPGLSDGSFVPGRELLAAHLLVHGLAQHGLDPGSYPMGRMIADAQDMGLVGERFDEVLAGPFAWIARDVSVDEAAAVSAVVERLAAGEDPGAVAGGEDPAGRLLRHVVAGVLDPRYRASIHLAGLADLVPAGGRGSRLAHLLRSSVWLTRSQVDAIYGPPRTEVGYLGRRLWRPFDLVWRVCRYGLAWARYRFRTPT